MENLSNSQSQLAHPGSNFLISPGHLWLRFCLSWFISVAEFGKNKLQGDSASRGAVNSEAVPLGRYMEQRLSNTLLNLYDVRTHCECHIPNTKEPKEGRVHLHLKHQQPWNQCLWKMGIRDCCQEDGHSAEEMVWDWAALLIHMPFSTEQRRRCCYRECQWTFLLTSSQPSPGCASLYTIKFKIFPLAYKTLQICFLQTPLLLCHWLSLPRRACSHVPSMKVAVNPKVTALRGC